MFIKELKNLGLNSGEAKVYSFLLTKGDSPVSEIVKATSLGRTNIYEYAESLKKLALLSSYEKQKKIVYHAESPQELKELIQNKVMAAQQLERSLADLLPKLEVEYLRNSGMPFLKYFFGDSGFREINNMLYQQGSERELFILLSDLDTYEPPEPRYRSIMQARQLFIYLMANKGKSFLEMQKRDARENRKTVLVELEFGQDLAITENKIIFGNFNRRSFSVSVLSSYALAELFKNICKNVLR